MEVENMMGSQKPIRKGQKPQRIASQRKRTEVLIIFLDPGNNGTVANGTIDGIEMP